MAAARQPASKASPTKGEAARAEVTPAEKTIDFRGLTLTVPAVLPGTLYFDMAALEENSGSLSAQVSLLKSLLGGDQLAAVREKIAADEVSFADVEGVIVGLFNDVLAAHGMSMGESEASQGS